MKNIKIYLEDAGVVVTPANTMGMGNPMPPTEGQPGSEPMEPTAKCKKEKCKKCKKKSLKESLLDDEDILMQNTDDYIRITDNIKKFLQKNYIIRGTFTIKNNIVDIDGSITVKNNNIKHLTNKYFKFGTVTSYFSINNCPKLKSLKGAPKKCYRFDCPYCTELKTLEGAPEKIELDFICSGCNNLISLKGCPKIVPRDFYCDNCNKLITLKYGPESVGNVYSCSYCDNLILDDKTIQYIKKIVKPSIFER